MAAPTIERRLARLRARLAGQLALGDGAVTLSRAGRRYRLLVPADHDRLLDEAEADPEEHLPYWAEIWPSGIALADLALERAADLAGQPVLELGCGLGITATAALQAGARLLVTDYSPVALALCRYNALRNAGRAPAALQLNWRQPADDLFRRVAAARGFPVVLAADVLYEQRDIAPLLALVPRLLRPGGALWLAEPGRLTSRRFLEEAAERGWECISAHADGPWPDSRVRVGLHVLRPPGA
ncbi:MAG TPA: methyltransferase [Thermomicrobiales bacterium]|nr:methyltransferase [Thermomicrobiales bacterium]